MSIRHAAQPQFPIRSLREGPAAPWVRPADWPGLPWIPDADQALVGLVAVHDTDNEKLAVLCAGAYTVDWGDGTTPENVATGVKAEHQYTYSTLATPVTSRGYKTAIVKLYPQAGQNLTTINLQQKASGMSASAVNNAWLELQINAALCTTLVLGGSTVALTYIERVNIRSHAATSLNALFRGMYSLRLIDWFNTSSVTSITEFCYQCASLTDFPFLDFASAISCSSGFYFCCSLQKLPALNFSSATTLSSLLYQCYSLRSIPKFVTGAAYSINGMAQYCQSLREIADIDFSGATNVVNAFANQYSLVRSRVTGMKLTHSYASCSLSATALNEIFTNLATVTGQTITVTGNPGAATCDTSIATAKGWTVAT